MQRHYSQLSDEEKGKARSLSPVEQFYLQFFVQQPIRTNELLQQTRRLAEERTAKDRALRQYQAEAEENRRLAEERKRELAAKSRSLQQYQTEAAQIRRSFTYRIGVSAQ